MAGIYLHIPFCKQACHYCNFHFSTSLKLKNDFVRALLLEMEQRKDYLNGQSINTIYFGGGTPSLLSKDELNTILDALHQHFSINADAEITLEANPDDLSLEGIQNLKSCGVNRLSIGVQSFEDGGLQWMNRAHNARQAVQSMQWAQEAGISNLTIDLIYGVPGLSNAAWKANIKKAIELGVPHISAYSLTVEPKTALENMIKQGKKQPVNEEQAAGQFEILMDELQANGYEHYEISNFSLLDRYSKHNSNYWKNIPYLGLGPSAHSYNGQSRRWNVAHNMHYIKSVENGAADHEEEILTTPQKINEYLMTSLRTIWGCDWDVIRSFNENMAQRLMRDLEAGVAANKLKRQDETYYLTRKGKLIADRVIGDLFIV